jgi:uncharacterized alpha-E superfamily protein
LAEPHAPRSVAHAYSELATGLRELAGSLPRRDSGAAAAESPDLDCDQRAAVVVQLLRDAVRGAGEVGACSMVIAGLIVLGFNVWVAISPPLRV